MRITALGLCLLTLTGCGWFKAISPRAGEQAYTCSNVSPIGQQYMRTRNPDALDCGPMGQPIPVPQNG